MLISSPERLRTDDPELLIEEARQHRRRRRLRLAAVLAAALGAGAGLWALLGTNAAATSATGRTSGEAVSTHCPGTDLGLLAFVREGTLRVVDFEHCRPTTLVESGATGTPAFSHDGSYVSFGHGYVATSGGEVRRTSGAPVWSPVANLLAVTTAGGGIELISPRAFARMIVPSGRNASAPVFAPNGRSIAFVRGTAIWSVDVASGALRKLVDTRRTGQPLPVGFSPNGAWLVYHAYPRSASLAADGTTLVAANVRTGRTVAIDSTLGRSDFVTWCGNTVAYVSGNVGRSVTAGDGIAIASAPAWKPQTVLAPGGATSWNAVACSGGELVVSAGPTSQDSPFGQEHRSLWAVDAKPHATPHLLAGTTPSGRQTDELPMWSSDPRWLVFVRTTPAGVRGTGSVYAYDLARHDLVGPVARVGGTGNYYGSYAWAGQIALSR
jgi:Tol biopolymer transport system component